MALTHLDRLEAEAIYIMREVTAECERPVMLYSIGKDSSVMMHLALKAFYPEKPPFPFLHIDTGWKFKEMIEFRDKRAKELGVDMIVYRNEEAIKKGINPFDHGSAYTDIMKTNALKAALDKYNFTAAFGGEDVMKRNHVLRSVYFHLEIKIMHGTLKINVQKCGSYIILKLTRVKA